MSKHGNKDKDKDKKKVKKADKKDRQAEKKPALVANPAADALAEKLTGRLPGYDRPHALWAVTHDLGELLAPELVKQDGEMRAARKKLEAGSDESRAVAKQQRDIKQQIIAIVGERYPAVVEAMNQAKPIAPKEGSNGRKGRSKSPAAVLAAIGKRVVEAQRKADGIIAEAQQAVVEAQAKRETLAKNDERNKKKRQRIEEAIAASEAKIAELQARIKDHKDELKGLESDADLTKADEIIAKATMRLARAKESEQYKQARERIDAVLQDNLKAAQAVAAGKTIYLDENGEIALA